MPEDTKINLDALMKKHTPTNTDVVDVTIDSSNQIKEQQATTEISVDTGVNTTPVTTEAEITKIETPKISLGVHKSESWKETWEDTNSNIVSDTNEDLSPQGNRHSLSLAALKTRWRTEEEIDADRKEAAEKLEIQENLEKAQAKELAAENLADKADDDKEVFWNYESKFSSQSTQILKRLRMPKTRIWMLFSLTILCVGIIGALMYIDPKTHSISNYKASVSSIYNDIKNGEQSKWPTGVITPAEDISRKDNIQNQEIPDEIEDSLDNNVEIKAEIKEEIKKENLKNFLLENYK